jgi:prepilin peptidase CpaA
MLWGTFENSIVDPILLVRVVSWIVCIFVAVAAIIDGLALKVPNWLTFPMIVLGWIVGGTLFGWWGLAASLLGTAIGLLLLLPLYAIGGMGAGDVKLLAGVGAWLGVQHTIWTFVYAVIIGAFLAIFLAAWKKRLHEFLFNMAGIAGEIAFIRDPVVLAHLASERKPRAILLPYGIPIALGCVTYLACWGMLL